MIDVQWRGRAVLVATIVVAGLVLAADHSTARAMTDSAIENPACKRASTAECATNPVPCAQTVTIDTTKESESAAESPLVDCVVDSAGAARPSVCASLMMPVNTTQRDASAVDTAKQAECNAEGQVEDEEAVSEENHNFGTRSMNGPDEYYGSEVSIRVPYDGFVHDDDEFILHRVVVQSSFTADREEGLVQTGIYRSGPNTYIDTCYGASNRNYYRYYEWKLHYTADHIDNYHCRVFTEQGALAPGSDADTTFGVHYTGPTWSDPKYNWRIDVRSDTHVTLPLDFHTGFPAIGAEMFDNGYNDGGGANDFASQTATVYGTTRHWRIDDSVNDTTPQAVGAGQAPMLYTPQHDPARWTVPDAPTPFTIQHR